MIFEKQASSEDDTSIRDVLYFGFFFDEDTASSMNILLDSYLNLLDTEIPEFATFLQNVSTSANVTNPMEFYTKPLDPNTGNYDPLYHITAKYCGDHQASCREYEKNHSKLLDTKFEMNLVGLVFTSKTFGMRVDLTTEQRALFDEINGKAKQMANVPAEYKSRKSSLSFQTPLPGEFRLERQEPFPPALPATSTKAHVTVGCAPGVPAVRTGHNALLAIRYERLADEESSFYESWSDVIDPVDPNRDEMKVTLFKPNASSPPEDSLFVVYPRVKIIANATLARYFQKEPNGSTLSSVGSSVSCKNSVLVISFAVFSHLAILWCGKLLNGLI